MSKKPFLYITGAAMIAVAAIAFYVWNKPPETVDNKTGLKISAEKLAYHFEENEQNANTDYLNKVIEVTGVITELEKNQDGKTVVLLQSENPLSGVQCTMKEVNVQFTTGEKTSIKGFCDGYTTVVLLTDCIKIK